jgi:hypothetical protein
MLRFIRNLFRDPTADWPRTVQDGMLGELRLSDDADWWEGRIPRAGGDLVFRVGGEGAPAPALLAHVREIASDPDGFERRCATFLQHAASEYPHPGYADEVLALKLAAVNLHWPERPRDGMLEFDGGAADRLWRCDLIAGEPRDLGFDS